jgi:hypothetical protein
MQRLLAGAAAGAAATFPMTRVMNALHRRLPAAERYPLPPVEITMRVTDAAGVSEDLGHEGREAAVAVSHYGYGAAIGAAYAATAARTDAPAWASGVAFGLAVWAGSYLGWLPAAGLFPPATEEPPRRVALMVAAHVVWGASVGLLADRLVGTGPRARDGR